MRVSELIESLPQTGVPDTNSDVNALIERLPKMIGGRTRVLSGSEVRYSGAGQSNGTITVAALRDAAGPNVTMVDFFERFSSGGQISIQEKSAPDSRVLYLVGTGSDSNGRPSAAWAHPAGQWLYGVEADDWDILEQLIQAVKASLR